MMVRNVSRRLRGIVRRMALLVVILAILTEVRLCLWRLPYAAVRDHVDVLAHRRARFVGGVEPMWIVRWIGRVAWLVPKSTCLVRALTAQVLLARRGIPVEVVFGVRMKEGGKLDAHAWVEYKGRVLLGRSPNWEEYRVLRRETVTQSNLGILPKSPFL